MEGHQNTELATRQWDQKKSVNGSKFRSWVKELSIEVNGIQRVTNEERSQDATHVWNACTFWLSANFSVATLSVGMVGPLFGLNFWDSFAIITVVNVLTALVPAWTATFGLTGLRMLTFCRYSFGYWGNCIVVLFSLIAATGWNAINAISGASCLAALSDNALPAWAGVIILSTCVWVICTLGIKWIHKLDSFVWISPLVVWCVAAGTGARDFHGNAIPSPSGADGAASILSFIAVVFSFVVSWSNVAADYNVRMPVSTPRYKIFTATYVGILFPAVLVESLGAAIYSGAQTDPSWGQAFLDYGVGGPLAKALEPAGGFGKFLMVLAALSAVPNNIPNLYSFALQAQNLGPWAIKIPRILLVTLGFIAATILGCFASLSFASSLETVLNIVGYGIVVQITIVAEEHVVFRNAKWSSYDWEAWNDPSQLPFGWGGVVGFAFGFLGAALGMQVTWYAAPIADLIGTSGANIGHELAFAFSAITFPLARWAERRWTGK